MLGVLMAHIVGGHIGRISMELLHSGCITPLTHRQTHAAFALVALTIAPSSAAHSNNFRMFSPSCFPGLRAMLSSLFRLFLLPGPDRQVPDRGSIPPATARCPYAPRVQRATS